MNTTSASAAIATGGSAHHAGAGKTVAWLVSGDEGYGVQRTTLALTGALTRRGWSTPIISLSHGALVDASQELGCAVRCLDVEPAPSWGSSGLRKVVEAAKIVPYHRSSVPKVARALLECGADYVNVRLPNLVAIAGSAGQMAGIPCVWQMARRVETFPFDLARRLYERICARYDVLPLANSYDTAASLSGGFVTPRVLHLGADPHRFDPERVSFFSRAEQGIPHDAIVLGVFARLVASKGQALLLDAMLQLSDEVPDLHLMLVGGPLDSEYAKSLSAAAARAGATERLHLVGPTTAPERYYGIVDIPVNCRIDSEGFGLSVIEGMMMRRPVLVHALGGPRETVIHGTTGWHIYEPTVSGFIRGIRSALADRDRWQTMGAQARSHALRNFTFEAVAERFEQVLATLTKC